MGGYEQTLKLFEFWDKREDEIPYADLVESLSGLELDRADLAGALIFADRNYRRIAVRRRPHYEALVLCWKSGQRSPIHNHLGSSCVVRVVEGEATETEYVFSPCGRLVPQRSRTFPAGSVTGCRDAAIHQMANLQAPGRDLITLHVYSPPPASWNYFKVEMTTLADHDLLLSEGNRTVVVDFGQFARPADEPQSIDVLNSPETKNAESVIAIVGGGFSGTMVAVHVARLAVNRPHHVRLFEKSERPARGLAYGTRCDQHLLNVTASAMSALPDEPTHFLDWLRVRDPSAHQGTFAPRHVYGDYLEQLLTDSISQSIARIEVGRDEVVDLELDQTSKRVRLTTGNGDRLEADGVVLALGHPKPGHPPGLDVRTIGSGYVANPWSADALDDLAADDGIALIGSGLTAVDLIVEARARGHRGRIVTVSRHGLFPRRHQTSPALPRPHIAIGAGSKETARGLLRRARTEVAVCQAQGSDWRSVVDSMRPVTQTLWRSLDHTERARFVRHLAPQWDVHRHRVAPQIDEMLEDMRQSGRLIVVAGRVVSLTERSGSIEMSVRHRGACDSETIYVRRVINCTGPARDVSLGSSPLLRSLIARGIGLPGPLALGLEVSDSGALIGRDGREQDRVFAIGPLLKEHLWETTAVRELRVQAFELARRIVNDC